MSANNRHWYIDAWAVMDGYAFASLRPYGSIDASVTFFVAPPYFEPEPVASLATALAATRGHFQEGFRYMGEEVAFDSFTQVVETVRRAYRAGGVNLNGAPLKMVSALRTPEWPAAVHPASLFEDDMRKTWLELRGVFLDGFTQRTRREHLRKLFAALIEQTLPALFPEFLGSSIIGMLAELTDQDADRSVQARNVSAWIDRARALGMTVEINPPLHLLTVRFPDEGWGLWNFSELTELPPSLLDATHPIMYRTSGAQVNEVSLAYVVPIPHIFQAETRRKYGAIPTLGHLLAVATSDRQYLPAIQSMYELVPLLVLGLTRIPSAALPFHAFPPRRGSPELRALSDRAAAWLAEAMPSEILRGHVAEAALHAFVAKLLGRGDEEEEVRAMTATM